jgi:hypothetical protein
MSAAAIVGLKNVQHFADARPEQFRLRQIFQNLFALGHDGTGSTPVSAMRPAKTETTGGNFGMQRRRHAFDLLQGENGRDV